MRFASEKSIVGQLIGLITPNWIKFKKFREIRSGVLDRPKATVASRRRHIAGYAVFCTAMPYLLAFSLPWVGEFAGVLPPDRLQQTYLEAQVQIREFAELRSDARAMCRNIQIADEPGGARCSRLMMRMTDGLDAEAELILHEIETFKAVQTGALSFFAAVIAVIISMYVFPRIWLKNNPRHAADSIEDREYVKRAYLLIMSTTLFLPNCIAAFILLVANILSRYEAAGLIAFSGWLTNVSALPLLVAGILGSYRLNEILLGTNNWRIGKTWWILLKCNAITGLIMLTLGALAFMAYYGVSMRF